MATLKLSFRRASPRLSNRMELGKLCPPALCRARQRISC